MNRTTWLRRATNLIVAATMASFGLTSIASAQTITNTGPDSHNTITSTNTNNCTTTNTNNLSASNYNDQSATSGNATSSDNTNAGLPWTGWNTLDPATAETNGQSYASWQLGVSNWVSQRASGNGWNSNDSNLTWAPSSTNWSSFDPVTWQANGQSFGNWYNSVESYLNSNSSNWLLTWPADATDSGNLGATSGNATNNYNANFSININNAARAAAGTNACGQSNFTPPPTTGGGGTGAGLGASFSPILSSPSYIPGSGSGGYSPGSSRHYAPMVHAPVVPTSNSVASAVTPPPPALVLPPPAAPASTISNTGPGSANTIASTNTDNSAVTNTNTVSVASYSNQSASSGDSTSASNTSTSGGGSGNATNAAGSGTGVDLSN